jgi:FkbM family methyltransferase
MPANDEKPIQVNRDLVTAAYRLLLEREPENEQVILHALARNHDVEDLRNGFLGSEEFAEKLRSFLARHPVADRAISQFQIYTGYKPEELSLIREYFCLSPVAVDGFIVDKLGVKTRGSSLWDTVQHLVGTVIPLPIPEDYHAGAIEWIGLLKSVRSARGRFVAMELGAGWGPWVVAGAIAARHAGISESSLLAVEGDPGHFGFLRQHFIDNGLNPDQRQLFQAAVGARRGRALWPRIDSRNDWGSRLIPANQKNGKEHGGVSSDPGREAAGVMDIEVLSISDLLTKQARWDLVHMDVQGDEAAICEAGLDLLTKRVHWIVVGTHSRIIEGKLISMFLRDGWQLENEKPARVVFRPNAPTQEALTDHDGAQVWRNPRLD